MRCASAFHMTADHLAQPLHDVLQAGRLRRQFRRRGRALLGASGSPLRHAFHLGDRTSHVLDTAGLFLASHVDFIDEHLNLVGILRDGADRRSNVVDLLLAVVRPGNRPINSEVCFAASPARPARFRTSSATTANPIPASPALAASTAAFKARIFVWNAISSITLMILEIFWLAVFNSSMAATVPSSELLASANSVCRRPINSTAARVFSVFLRAMELISSLDDDVSSKEAACSEDP